jgi:hypothetical protein
MRAAVPFHCLAFLPDAVAADLARLQFCHLQVNLNQSNVASPDPSCLVLHRESDTTADTRFLDAEDTQALMRFPVFLADDRIAAQ